MEAGAVLAGAWGLVYETGDLAAAGLGMNLSRDGEHGPGRGALVLDVLEESALQTTDVAAVDVPCQREVAATFGAPFEHEGGLVGFEFHGTNSVKYVYPRGIMGVDTLCVKY